ncbi:MAG: DnaJ domain-containing protein, partial [Gammaproteobacteria bacterium]|nr:DnaJ domain-containing protein [Gammaproteobacteria bacterium]
AESSHSVYYVSMQTNPLIIPILEFLKQSDNAVSILDIVAALVDESLFQSLSEQSSELMAFRKNFLVMNALYFLQRDLMGSGYGLSISAMSIRLEPVADSSSSSELVDVADEKLSDYYLDWANYHETGKEEIEQLLNDFWRVYHAQDKRLAALDILGLPESADWDQVQQVYRSLISQCHPDKGGEQKQFIEIREAYEVLKYCFNR